MNNPPAFPKTPFIELGTPQNGMTLRDYFAAKAMQGLISIDDLDMHQDDYARVAYLQADAMMKAREA
jgi:F0F1-type ATP synthase alpha subunit